MYLGFQASWQTFLLSFFTIYEIFSKSTVRNRKFAFICTEKKGILLNLTLGK